MSIQKQSWTLIQRDLTKKQTEITLSDDEHHYAFHVLRLTVGSKIEVTNCNGLTAFGTVTTATKKSIAIQIQSYEEHQKSLPEIHLWLAYPKPSTLDDVVASASELGADHIHIFKSEKSAIRNPIKIEKIQRISQESIRISKSSFSANISCYESLNELYQKNILSNTKERIVLFCDESHVYEGKIKNSLYKVIKEQYNEKINEICILIGPEASFSSKERAFIFEKITTNAVSLGNNILRVPNAVISSIGTIINFKNDYIYSTKK